MIVNDFCTDCRDWIDNGRHTMCGRKRQDANGIWHPGHVCAPCGHADARCERGRAA